MQSPVPIDALVTSVTMIQMMARGRASEPCKVGSASGFFFEHNGRKFLVTNRHVTVDENSSFYPDQLEIRVHVSQTSMIPTRDIILPLYDDERRPIWIDSHRTRVDLAAIEIGHALKDSDVIQFWNSQRFLPQDVRLELGDETLVIGYPMEFHDTAHYLPIVRSSTIATPFRAYFQGQPIFLIDANLHPGTSGSPVIVPSSEFQHMISGEIRPGIFPSYLLGVNSGEYSVAGVSLGLNAVWYADLLVAMISNPSN